MPLNRAAPRVRSTGGPIDAGSHAAREAGHVARGPVAIINPPPPSTKVTSLAAAASPIARSLRMITRAWLIDSVSTSGDCIEAAKRGDSPIDNARARYSVASADPCDTASSGTGAAGVIVKLKTLSRVNASTAACGVAPRRTTARVFGAVMVTGANDTVADALAAALIFRSCTMRPSISSWMMTSFAAVAVRFIIPAVTVTRSGWPASRDRNSATGVSARLAPCAPSTTAVVIVVPPGIRSVSSGCHPPR